MPLVKENRWSELTIHLDCGVILGLVQDGCSILEDIAIKEILGLGIEIISCVDPLYAIVKAMDRPVFIKECTSYTLKFQVIPL